MRAKFVNESIKHLKPRSKEEILKQINGRFDAIFKRSKQSSIDTSFTEEVYTSYKTLEKLFGKPKNGDRYKVSTEWIVEDEFGNIAIIYDWKATELYSSEEMSVKNFRKLPSYSWHIGTKNQRQVANDLITFIYLNS